jgi:hypothetical protein
MSDSRFVGLYDFDGWADFSIVCGRPGVGSLTRGIVGNNPLNFNMMPLRPTRLAVLATFGT